MLIFATTTECNGGSFFHVRILNKENTLNVEVWTVLFNSPDRLILEFIDIERFFVGIDNGHVINPLFNYKKDGNSILLIEKTGECVYIGNSIFRFVINDEKIQYLYSPTFNSYVVYPYIVTDKKHYLIGEFIDCENEEQCIPYISNETADKDVYDQYYNFNTIFGLLDVKFIVRLKMIITPTGKYEQIYCYED